MKDIITDIRNAKMISLERLKDVCIVVVGTFIVLYLQWLLFIV